MSYIRDINVGEATASPIEAPEELPFFMRRGVTSSNAKLTHTR